MIFIILTRLEKKVVILENIVEMYMEYEYQYMWTVSFDVPAKVMAVIYLSQQNVYNVYTRSIKCIFS